jgi:hypothetical protein
VEFITEGEEQDQLEGKPNLVAAVKVRVCLPARLPCAALPGSWLARCRCCAAVTDENSPSCSLPPTPDLPASPSHSPTRMPPQHTLFYGKQVIFSTGGFMPGTGVGLIFRILPTWMEPLLFHLFFTLWGSVAKRLEYARSTFMSTADLLMQARGCISQPCSLS